MGGPRRRLGGGGLNSGGACSDERRDSTGNTAMSERLKYWQVAPDALKPMRALEERIQAGSLGPALIELVKTRASQINGCAFCLHMHTHDALEAGERPERL